MGSLRTLKTEYHRDYVQEQQMIRQERLHVLLIGACQKNDPALVRDILEQGADVNFMGEEDELTIINYCYEVGADKVIHTLITYGNLDINKQDPETGTTPLHRAAEKAHYGVVNRLIKLGADITIKENCDQTPLEDINELLTSYDFDGPKTNGNEKNVRAYQLCKRILLKAERNSGQSKKS